MIRTVLSVVLGLLALSFPFLPLGAQSAFMLQIANFTVITAVLSLSWDILARTGQLSLAHAAFYGIGAYTYTILMAQSAPWWLAVLVSGLMAGLLSLILGAVTLRLQGMYFAIATLAFTEVIKTVIQNLPEKFAGGSTGMLVPGLFNGQPTAQYYAAVVLLAVTLLVSIWVRNSKLHYAFTAIRQGEQVARVLGVSANRYKLLAFFISSVLAGFAGVLYASKTFFIIPAETFSLSVSVSSLTTAIFGGLYTTLGPVIGSVILITLEELLRLKIPNGYLVVYGVMLVLTILYLPRGIMGLLERKKP
ncbi:branched-chain amino acid ABC transporter permease [Deinococcus misasensis]|uniref:branched-chain amino acid ABC transporter permease n=1 Tax=Deinococcus misasensis TaxID=392413 RepID=UPI0005513361|nr:branched-chain amino acid ABC transporter permease [Deinococcus misasensis]